MDTTDSKWASKMKTFAFPQFNYKVEHGKIANQADGSVWFQQGGTVVVATAVSAPTNDFPGFLPLTVDYREQFSAAGKIPGGYFKREGRSSEREVLTSRLIDRSIRPLFPAHYFNQLQVLVTVYSVDKEHSPHVMGLLAASFALTLSKIPFLGPIGAVEVARLDGEWVVNPTYPQSQKSDVRLIVAGTHEGICMVEGDMNELSEKQVVDALFLAHSHIQQLVKWQQDALKECNIAKEADEDTFGLQKWTAKAQEFLTNDLLEDLFVTDKVVRDEKFSALKKAFLEKHAEEASASAAPQSILTYVFDEVLKEELTALVIKKNKRVDQRAPDQVRNITTEVGLLPCTHGSAMFTRGRTQALVTVTLGGGHDEQKIEELMGETVDSSFMLHYNFPPFSVGEVRPMRGPGRREIGHGNLAASAIKRMLPGKEDFPYTIRIVADMLESDGSTSMATTCGSTMALMDAGVPLRKMVSGVAMGLLHDYKDKFLVLTDIAGVEDAFGLMDFKVTGTDDGVTAIQMDIKYKGGLPREVFESALEAARKGRLHILGEMRKVMTHSREQLSDLVPQVTTFKVDIDKIGGIIGPGGRIIREIIEATGTSIDIEDDGLVKIFGMPGADIAKAISWVKILGGKIEIGSVHHGKIKRVAEFGVFVELAPGKDGLVHISMFNRDDQRILDKKYPVGEYLTVKVVDYDAETGRIRLKLNS